MRNLIDNRGLTLMEIIVSIGIIGVVIIPIFNIFILSQKVQSISGNEYETMQTAQYYMEEIKTMDGIDGRVYSCDADGNSYKRVIMQDEESYGVEIRIIPDEKRVLHRIEIDIFDEGEVVNSLTGSVIFE